MRNLSLIDGVCVSFPSIENTKHISLDFDSGDIYLATKTNAICVDGMKLEVKQTVSLLDDNTLAPDGYIVAIQHVPDQMSLCIATNLGDIVMWSPTLNQLETIGTINNGISAMCWSPDQELVVMTTMTNTLLMMTHDLDPITELPMHPDEFGEAAFVNVGWGKKETQFHGSEGKQAATQSKIVTSSTVSGKDDLIPRISWRGDGQYFVINSINPQTGSRVLRVWTRECQLYSTSESASGIEWATSWKPSGGLVAVIQKGPTACTVSFIEKNGLYHGSFNLPANKDQILVKDLTWNTDSSLLAVWIDHLADDNDPQHMLSTVLTGKLVMEIGHFGHGSSETLAYPIGITVNKRGDILICDNGNDMVKVFHSDGRHAMTLGSKGGKTFYRPSAIVTNDSCDMFIKDDVQIQVFDTKGNLLRCFGRGLLRLPYGLCINHYGDVITLDINRRNPRIMIFSQEGKLIKEGPYTPLLTQTSDVSRSKCRFLSTQGANLIVSDLGRSSIFVTTFNGKFLQEFGSYGQFNEPSGVTVDQNKNILIADSKNDRIQVFSPEYEFMFTINLPSGAAGIKRPSDIHITDDGNLFIVNFLEHNVKKYKLVSEVKP